MKGKTALITGSSFGIGKSTAIAFARAGVNVILADWVEDEDTLAQVKQAGANGIFIKCDVSDADQVKKMIDKGVETFGRLDFAFNNAGIEGQQGATADCTVENWNKTLAINLTGAWNCMRFEIPYMLKQGGGSIVNCASIAGLVGFMGVPAYVASKHGLVGLTKTAALEYAKTGIRVNAICPGVIRTPMIDRFTGNDKVVEKQFESLEPVGRLGEPEEVASAVLWLCSDGASFVTGQAIAVDGGWVAQ